MKRLVVLLIVAVLVMPASAQAVTPFGGGGGIKVRNDGDDTGNILDIRQVASGLNRRQAVFGLQTWDVHSALDIDAQDGSWFQFNLDTKRRGRADRYLYMYYWPPDNEFYCEVQTREGTFIGLRVAQRGDDFRSMFCGVRRVWLDIEKQVKFAVESRSQNVYVDRAPNFGRYRGL